MIPIQWEFRDLIVGITNICCIVMGFIAIFFSLIIQKQKALMRAINVNDYIWCT